MAGTYVPLQKQSKRAQKAHHARQRNGWNGVNPVTRPVPSRTGYSRVRLKQADRRRIDEGD